MDSTRLPGRAAITTLCRYALICGITALVAACGLQNSPAQGKGGRTGKPIAAVRECTAADLRVRLDIHAAGVAAGTSYIPLDFTNVSSAGCRLAGFPAISLAVSRAGKQLGTAAAYDRSTAAQSMVVGGGQTAHIWLRLVDVANLPAATCRPVAAAGLLVRLPGQRQAIFVSHQLTTCANPVHGTDILTIEPFHPGRAKPGTAQ